MKELARDPAKGWKYDGDTLREADVALRLEQRGQLAAGIRRSPDPKADFIDGIGQKWDVYRVRGSGGKSAVSNIGRELHHGENVIVDTRSLSDTASARLLAGVRAKGESWAGRVVFYP